MIRISVRNLVEFILRTGDIDNRIGKGAQAEAMQEGARMHRKIQGRMGADYRAEVSLKLEIPLEEYSISVEGRADGIFTDLPCHNGGHLSYEDGEGSDEGLQGESSEEQSWSDISSLYIIDEIKCMYTDVTRFEQPIEVHRAQAMCYAYMYALQEELEVIGIQMTYCDLETMHLKRFREDFTFEELENWFSDIINRYRKWTDFQYEWNQKRQASIKGLEFPFPYREGQKQLVADVYRTMARKKILFLQAPTGTGKTIATVFPAVKAVGEGLADKIFYLTAKTVTRTVAGEAFMILKEKGYQGKVVTITAKDKMCVCEEADCNPVNCPRAKGHYDRVNDAVYDVITHEHELTRETLLAYAEKHQVCPFEMTLDVTLWSDVIICDYNYVFDPNIYLKRFFADGAKGDYLFLVDEAHNLVDRGREMYSATLIKEQFLHQKHIFKNRNKKIVSALEKCNRQMLEWKRECESYRVYESIGAFAFSLMRLMSLLDEFLQKRVEFPERKEVTEFYLNLRHFMNMFERLDENYVIYTDFNGDGEFCLHLYCVNPALNLQECLDKGKSSVYFSATLLPISYYKNLLSSKPDNYAVYARSTFEKEQRLLFIAKDVSSLYTRRNISEYRRIAAYIYETAAAKKGNYISFFPSYKFMEEVYEQFLLLNQGRMDSLLQSSNMKEDAREAFMAEFNPDREKTLVGFCVLGGIFSEGIDLKGNQLIGALIVGTGLPQICSEREVLKGYYGQKDASGQESDWNRSSLGYPYAYQYPGMNKVLQAAGRVIRTAADVGVIGLLDERFLRRDYLELFPREWEDYRVTSLEQLPELLKSFW